MTDECALQVPVHITSALSSMTVSWLIMPLPERDLMWDTIFDIV